MFLLIICVHVKSAMFTVATMTTGIYVALVLTTEIFDTATSTARIVVATTLMRFFVIVIVFVNFTIIGFDICDGYF